MLALIWSGKKRLLFGILPLVVLAAHVVFAEAQSSSPPSNPLGGTQIWWTLGTILLLFVIVGGGLGYMFLLQKRFLNACREENQLSLFFQSPAGLPEGTVRSVIALVIITTSLYLAILVFFNAGGDNSKFPEVLSGLVGAVIGFYFGSRSAGKGEESALQGEIKIIKAQRDNIEAEKVGMQSDSLVNKIEKGIAMSKSVSILLPEHLRKKYDDTIGKLEDGLKNVENLTGLGNIKDAAVKAGEVFDLFKGENPVRDIYTNGVTAIGKVIGGSVPAVAVIMAVVAAGVKLTGVLYQKWKNRILNAPFNLAELPLRVVDASTAYTLLRSSPKFKNAFAQELDERNWPFIETAFKLLQQEDVEQFWAGHKNRFESRQDFEEGVREFRKAAVDMELQDIEPALFAKAGGLKPFMASMEKIHSDPEAKAALDAVVTVVEGLQSQGQPVPAIFEKVQAEVQL